MTRETKIGLLVGLAFIIVIGILLSDHMTSTTQPQQAVLTETATNVRSSVASPTPAGQTPQQIGHVAPISPTTPVLTQAEINKPVAPVTPQTPSVTQVVIGGPAAQPTQPITIQQTQTPAPQSVQSPATPVVTSTQAPSPTNADTELAQWTRQPGDEVVTSVAPEASKPKKAEYIAVAGDSLSKMASKLLGSDTKANREAIVKANPTLQKNPNIIVIGRKYTIPLAAAPATAAKPAPASEISTELVPVTPGAKSIPVTELVDALPAPAPAAAPAKSDGSTWYIVKENDNLWKIASAELGSGNAWVQLKELNKDILKGKDTVQPNMRIRIPAKSVANAS